MEELIKKLQSIQDTFDSIIIQSAKELKGEIEKLNVSQMQAGKKGNDSEIKPSYALKTITRKRKLGQPFDRVTLKDKGDFHDSLSIEFRDDEFELTASDFKTPFLKHRYTKEILGLNSESLELLKDKIKPLIIDKVKQHLQ